MTIAIKKGILSLYYCFDVAYEIRLDEVKTIFGRKPETSKLVCERLIPEYVQYKIPPLLVRLGKQTITTEGQTFEAEAKAKLYSFGIITIVYQIPIDGPLRRLISKTSLLAENVEIAKLAEAQVARLVKELKPVMDRPVSKFEFWEDYIIISVKEFDRPVTAKQLLSMAKTDIAKILRCETERLSEFELENALKYTLSYYENELVVVDWQAAFIYDPKQSYDVPDVLEYATIELLELRAYDEVLDAVLERAYSDLEKPSGLSLTPYSKILQNLTKVKLDVTEVIDKVTDALKLIGDLYLAKVYKAASQRFYLDDLRVSLNDKLKTVESIYHLLFERANNRLLIILELMIVGLFIIDIGLILAGII